MKKLSKYLFGFVTIVVVACNMQHPSDSSISKNNFSLSDFGRQEYEKIYIAPISVEKKLIIDGKEETVSMVFDSVSWKKELGILFKNDLNNPAWQEKITVTKGQTSAGNTLETYRMNDDKIALKSVAVEKDSLNHVIVVNIKTGRKNLLSQTEQEYTYEPKRGYSMKSFQRALFMSNHEIYVTANFINKK